MNRFWCADILTTRCEGIDGNQMWRFGKRKAADKTATDLKVAQHFDTVGPGAVVLVHIGKCGGKTVKAAIERSARPDAFIPVHMEKPPLHPDYRYLIVLRNPMSRVVSAYNWRRKLTVEEGRKKFAHEEEAAFARFETINQAAEALYSADWHADAEAHRLLSSVWHVGTGLTYHIGTLVEHCRPDQIDGVILQEFLDQDIEDHFGVPNTERFHYNSSSGWQAHLSELGARNLRRFLSDDYMAIARLYSMGKISADRLLVLLA